ncbi:MAG: amidohydrolase [Amphiplicatus sp.]
MKVGARADIDPLAGRDAEVIELESGALYPGFVDSHAHLLGIGLRELTLNLEGVGSIDELVDIVAANVTESPPGATVYGRGWIETGWPEKRMPTRDDLDPVSPDNPVVLTRADGHAAVVNSAALAAAGVDAQTPDPEGGRIEKDASGRPTGMLIDRAMDLVSPLIGAPDEARRNEAYAVGARVYAAYGWTGLHNMSVEPEDVAIMERLAAQGDLPIRVYNALEPAGLDWLEENAPRTDDTGRVITRAVKLYADGALGSRGAALFEPYADAPDTAGLLLMTPDEAKALMRRALAAGVQVCTHAIGDKANALALDWYAEALQGAQGEPRWRIEHAQIVRPADIPRFAALGVIASMQPSHAIGDLFFAPARLGPGRLDGAYAWRSLIDADAIIAGGSDAPVERGDPLIEFYAAVARRSLDGFQGEDWRPEEAVTREEALKMFTLWPAYASFQESALGSIEPGKRADFTAFSKDIMTIPVAEIPTARATLTVVDGVVAYRGN